MITVFADTLRNTHEPERYQLTLPLLPPPRERVIHCTKGIKRSRNIASDRPRKTIQPYLSLDYCARRYVIPSVHPIPYQSHSGLARIVAWLDQVLDDLGRVLPKYSTTTCYRIRRDRARLLCIDSRGTDTRVFDLLDDETREKFAKVANLAFVSGDREFCDLMPNLLHITKWLVHFVRKSDEAGASTPQHR